MKESFGKTLDGAEADLYTLRNVHALEGYLNEHPCFGATIGRHGNRIATGVVTLDGRMYQLTRNDGENHLHGGVRGFDKVVWTAGERETMDGPAVDLRYVSSDGEEGYPGTLTVDVTYTLTTDNELKIDYTAETDRTTVINLTHHSYFNLRDAGRRDILEHELKIDADYFLPIDQSSIPTGEIRTVKGTPFDFTKLTPIGARIAQEDLQLVYGNGYNHNWMLNKQGQSSAPAAVVYEPTSGR